MFTFPFSVSFSYYSVIVVDSVGVFVLGIVIVIVIVIIDVVGVATVHFIPRYTSPELTLQTREHSFTHLPYVVGSTFLVIVAIIPLLLLYSL